MTWRVHSIALYSRKGNQRHVLSFEREGFTAGLFVISGASARGKSTILEILDYCFLSKNCSIPKGIFRRYVSHVAVLLEGLRNRMVILRPLPEEGRITSSEVHIQQGANIELPVVAPVRYSWNRDTAKGKLSEFTGIDSPPVLTNFESSDWAERGAANVRHCAPYLFQPQDIIASRNVTFPGIDGVFERIHFLDAMRYFLGVFTVDSLQRKYELRRLLAERNRAGRQLVEARSMRAQESTRARELWQTARSFGLVEKSPGSHPEYVRGLQELVRSGSFKVSDESSDIFAAAQEEEARLTELLRSQRLELSKYTEYSVIESQHALVTEEQIERLRLRELLPSDVKDGGCPLCGEGVLDLSSLRDRMDESTRALEEVRAVPARLKSRLERKQKQLNDEIAATKRALDQAKAQMRQIVAAQMKERTMLGRVGELARFEGAVREYLRSVAQTADTLRDDNASIDERINELESEVGELVIAKKTSDVQELIGSWMTKLAGELDVEFPGKPVRLNLEELRIEVAVDSDNFVPLSQLGSGANWLGYHIAACLALHEYFVMHQRPVPNVLVLDQPSQVWFPAARARFRGVELPEDLKDREALMKVYRLLSSFSKRGTGIQIVVMDHARLENTEFQDALIADWHAEGEGLVPKDWIDDK